MQALYHRRSALKHQFKNLAQIQKEALDLIAEKALSALQEHDYYKSLPEYEVTTSELAVMYERVQKQLDAREKLEREYLIKKQAMDEEYAEQVFQVSPVFVQRACHHPNPFTGQGGRNRGELCCKTRATCTFCSSASRDWWNG